MTIEWPEIEAFAKNRLESERVKNDAVGLSDAETNAIRGRISILKELLRLPETLKIRQSPAHNGEPDE